MRVWMRARQPDEKSRCVMNDKKIEFQRSLDGVIGARTREATRQINFRFQHQLIGAVTKRP